MVNIGQEIRSLGLPPDVLVTAVIRGEEIVTPLGDTVIEEGDTLYILGPKSERERIKEVFRFQEVPFAPAAPEPELIRGEPDLSKSNHSSDPDLKDPL
ncbi:potassium/proton antiporter [compost metagenome]